jgi:hypothetical protein
VTTNGLIAAPRNSDNLNSDNLKGPLGVQHG